MLRRIVFLAVVALVVIGAALAISLPSNHTANRHWEQTISGSQSQAPPGVQSGTPLVIERTPIQQEYQDDFDRLESLRSSGLDNLVVAADHLERKWRDLDGNLYSLIMDHVCNAIANSRFSDTRVRSLTEEYARVALSHTDKFSWNREWRLLLWLGYERLTPDDAVWTQERREKTVLWLHAWQRLEREIDPGFDPNDRRNRGVLRVSPPDETGLRPGSPPEAIKDPKLRAEYEKAIAENEAKRRRNNQQLPLHWEQKPFVEHAEKAVIKMYSQPPYDTEELRGYLKTYVADKSARQTILSEVAKTISQAQAP
jgi:hypothetical protein